MCRGGTLQSAECHPCILVAERHTGTSVSLQDFLPILGAPRPKITNRSFWQSCDQNLGSALLRCDHGSSSQNFDLEGLSDLYANGPKVSFHDLLPTLAAPRLKIMSSKWFTVWVPNGSQDAFQMVHRMRFKWFTGCVPKQDEFQMVDRMSSKCFADAHVRVMRCEQSGKRAPKISKSSLLFCFTSNNRGLSARFFNQFVNNVTRGFLIQSHEIFSKHFFTKGRFCPKISSGRHESNFIFRRISPFCAALIFKSQPAFPHTSVSKKLPKYGAQKEESSI